MAKSNNNKHSHSTHCIHNVQLNIQQSTYWMTLKYCVQLFEIGNGMCVLCMCVVNSQWNVLQKAKAWINMFDMWLANSYTSLPTKQLNEVLWGFAWSYTTYHNTYITYNMDLWIYASVYILNINSTSFNTQQNCKFWNIQCCRTNTN